MNTENIVLYVCVALILIAAFAPRFKVKKNFMITMIKPIGKSHIESGKSIEWGTVPRKGEVVALKDGQYIVVDVIHNFIRGMDSDVCEISLLLEPKV